MKPRDVFDAVEQFGLRNDNDRRKAMHPGGGR